MTTRNAMALAGLVLALAILSPAAALANAGGTDRPLPASWSQTTSLDPATGAVVSDGAGVTAHIGKFSVHTEGTGAHNPADNTFVGSGNATVVAANGDQFTTAYTFTSSPTATGRTVDIEQTITGGTGRFADASGTLQSSCLGGPPSPVGGQLITKEECTGTGHISY